MSLSDLSQLDPWSSRIVLTGAAVAVLLGFLRWVLPRFRRVKAKVGGVSDAILGREAILDRATGKELVPAQPGIGVRLASQEQNMELLTITVTKLVDQQRAVQALTSVVDGHGDRITVLEDAAAERIVSKVETAHMFQAMDSAIKATPPPAVEE